MEEKIAEYEANAAKCREWATKEHSHSEVWLKQAEAWEILAGYARRGFRMKPGED